jgi:hypothetical protein
LIVSIGSELGYVSTKIGTARVDALECLLDLFYPDDDDAEKNRLYMCSKEFGLLQSQLYCPMMEMRVKYSWYFVLFVSKKKNSIYMGSKELGLLPVLVSVASLSNDEEEACETVPQTIFNLS